MKTLPLLVTVAASLLAVSGLHAQNTQNSQITPDNGRTAHTTTRTVRNSSRTRSNFQRSFTNRGRGSAISTTPQRVDGGFVRAYRSGNPLQMVNPAAPAEYGDGRDVTRHEVDDPFQRPQGLRLFAFDF